MERGQYPNSRGNIQPTNRAGRTDFLSDFLDGGPGKTRTCDLRFRKPLLYPAELRDQQGKFLL